MSTDPHRQPDRLIDSVLRSAAGTDGQHPLDQPDAVPPPDEAVQAALDADAAALSAWLAGEPGDAEPDSARTPTIASNEETDPMPAIAPPIVPLHRPPRRTARGPGLPVLLAAAATLLIAALLVAVMVLPTPDSNDPSHAGPGDGNPQADVERGDHVASDTVRGVRYDLTCVSEWRLPLGLSVGTVNWSVRATNTTDSPVTIDRGLMAAFALVPVSGDVAGPVSGTAHPTHHLLESHLTLELAPGSSAMLVFVSSAHTDPLDGRLTLHLDHGTYRSQLTLPLYTGQCDFSVRFDSSPHSGEDDFADPVELTTQVLVRTDPVDHQPDMRTVVHQHNCPGLQWRSTRVGPFVWEIATDSAWRFPQPGVLSPMRFELTVTNRSDRPEMLDLAGDIDLTWVASVGRAAGTARVRHLGPTHMGVDRWELKPGESVRIVERAMITRLDATTGQVQLHSAFRFAASLLTIPGLAADETEYRMLFRYTGRPDGPTPAGAQIDLHLMMLGAVEVGPPTDVTLTLSTNNVGPGIGWQIPGPDDAPRDVELHMLLRNVSDRRIGIDPMADFHLSLVTDDGIEHSGEVTRWDAAHVPDGAPSGPVVIEPGGYASADLRLPGELRHTDTGLELVLVTGGPDGRDAIRFRNLQRGMWTLRVRLGSAADRNQPPAWRDAIRAEVTVGTYDGWIRMPITVDPTIEVDAPATWTTGEEQAITLTIHNPRSEPMGFTRAGIMVGWVAGTEHAIPPVQVGRIAHMPDLIVPPGDTRTITVRVELVDRRDGKAFRVLGPYGGNTSALPDTRPLQFVVRVAQPHGMGAGGEGFEWWHGERFFVFPVIID